MKREARNTMLAALVALAASVALFGCSGNNITGVNAAPNTVPTGNRQAMIDWHQQHDKKPASATPSGQ